MKNIKYYDIFINESIRHLLKPKSEEEIKKSLQNFHKLPELDKVNYFLKYDLVNILSKDKCKELINTINLGGRLEVIFKLKLEGDLFTNEEIKKLIDDKTPEELINKSYLNKSNWLLIYALKKGAKLNDIKYANIYISKQELHDRIYNIFINACQENNIELVKILLNDEGFDPSIGTYSASFFINRLSVPLVFAYKKGNYEIVRLLFKDKRIRNILNDREIMFLEEKMPELFEQNESIRHLLKPKSQDEIIKTLKDMSIEDKNKIMMDFIKQEDLNMILFMLNNGLEINSHMINISTLCSDLSIYHLLRYYKRKKNFIERINNK